MSRPTLGIIGGGQLGSLLAEAAKTIEIKTVILSDDINAPAKKFAYNFIYGKYDCIIIMESDKTDSLKTDIFLLRKTPNITSTLTMMVID